MPSSHLILCHPLLLLPPIPPSIRVFSNESTLHVRWPKYWSFSFSIIHSKEIPGLISFRMDWLDLLAVQGTLKSLLQHHSSKASILQRSAFFTVQLAHPYMTSFFVGSHSLWSQEPTQATRALRKDHPSLTLAMWPLTLGAVIIAEFPFKLWSTRTDILFFPTKGSISTEDRMRGQGNSCYKL